MSAINVSGRTATNLMEPGTYETLTQEDIETRIYGSKIVILLEQAMLTLTWGIKGCMILFYNRLTYRPHLPSPGAFRTRECATTNMRAEKRTRLKQQIVIRAIGVYIIAGFIAVEMAWFLTCRPLSGYWALPVPMRLSPLSSSLFWKKSK
jgi:hypothetical protein